MYKNCDMSYDVLYGSGLDRLHPRTSQRLQFAAANLAVLADGRCFLPWIAEVLGMQLGEQDRLSEQEIISCDLEKGDKNDKVKHIFNQPNR